MRISYRHKFIFIHVDRTGGTSISTALDRYSFRQSDLSRLVAAALRRIGFRAGYYRWQKNPTQHVSAAFLKSRLPTKVFESYFKFAFVRNPWDWIVSLYHARLQHPVHPEYELARYLGDFPSYLQWWVDNKRSQQKDLLVDDNNNLLVDFVGRFESLESDFKTICRRLGLKLTLPHRNDSIFRVTKDYREYFDADTRDLVAEVCADDIRLFGYSFDVHGGPVSPIDRTEA